MHEVIVGNIGAVYRGGDSKEAQRAFQEYKRQSRYVRGRAFNEPVTWLVRGKIHKEYNPKAPIEF